MKPETFTDPHEALARILEITLEQDILKALVKLPLDCPQKEFNDRMFEVADSIFSEEVMPALLKAANKVQKGLREKIQKAIIDESIRNPKVKTK